MGNKNYESNIADFKKTLAQKEIQALHTVGVFVRGEAVVRAPVITGNLMNSITTKVIEEEKTVILGTNVEYALTVEKGIGRKPKPFITPAIEENIDKINQLIKKVMGEI